MDETKDNHTILTSLKAGAVRAIYVLLLGVRDPISSLPHFADAPDVEPLVDALLTYPDSSSILEWTSRCFATLGIIRVNQQLLIAHGAVRAVVRAMKKQQNNPTVILYSLRALYALLGSPEGGDAAAAEGTSTLLYDIVHHGITKNNGEIVALAKEELKIVEGYKFTILEEKARLLNVEMSELNNDLRLLDSTF